MTCIVCACLVPTFSQNDADAGGDADPDFDPDSEFGSPAQGATLSGALMPDCLHVTPDDKVHSLNFAAGKPAVLPSCIIFEMYWVSQLQPPCTWLRLPTQDCST